MPPDDIRPCGIVAESGDAVNMQLIHAIADRGEIDAHGREQILKYLLYIVDFIQYLMRKVTGHIQPLRQSGDAWDEQDPGEADVVKQAHGTDRQFHDRDGIGQKLRV